jgi:hypothetical protein
MLELSDFPENRGFINIIISGKGAGFIQARGEAVCRITPERVVDKSMERLTGHRPTLTAGNSVGDVQILE